MHIEKYTKIPLDDSGENFLYIKNHCLGYIKGGEGLSSAYNKKTGETFDEIALYEQIVDEKGEPLKKPLVGDNEDYCIRKNGEEISLVDLFRKLWSSPNTKEEENNDGK